MTIDILISTMFRTSLDFLEPMFVDNDMEDFNLIIVNQTSEDRFLDRGSSENITVINTLQRGSPASRNMAIRASTANICLMSDDDIIYLPHLRRTIISAYEECSDADMISFQAIDEDGRLYTNYFPEGRHTKASLKKIYTWVISFNRKRFVENKIYFNHYFGVGSVFKGETEYVFLRTAYDRGLNMFHKSANIVQHPNDNSGRRMGSDNGVAARSALHQRFYGNLSYLWLLKYLLFLVRHDYIKIKELPYKFKVGIKAITLYKKLDRTGQIDKIHES